MANAKDKAFHADGSMTAAEYKRRFLNKKAIARARQQVDIRFAVTHAAGVTKADKARLRNVHINAEARPGDFYNPKHENDRSKLRAGRNTSHVRVTL